MSNYRRSYEGRLFFFTLVTHKRRRILTTDKGRESLRKAIDDVRSKWPFEIVAFVLLPDHLHTIWKMPAGDVNYSTRWRRIKSLFTRYWRAAGGQSTALSQSRMKRREQGVWQRRFFEHTIQDENDLKKCIDYIHVNPLKHGLVEQVKDWEWSTFHRFVRQGEYSSDWGRANEWYGDEFEGFE